MDHIDDLLDFPKDRRTPPPTCSSWTRRHRGSARIIDVGPQLVHPMHFGYYYGLAGVTSSEGPSLFFFLVARQPSN